MRVKKFESGAKRETTEYRFDLIAPDGMFLLAKRYAHGAEKYGDENWKKGVGDKEFENAVTGHLFEHLLKYLANGNDEEHEGPGGNLGAIMWGVNTRAYIDNHK